MDEYTMLAMDPDALVAKYFDEPMELVLFSKIGETVLIGAVGENEDKWIYTEITSRRFENMALHHQATMIVRPVKAGDLIPDIDMGGTWEYTNETYEDGYIVGYGPRAAFVEDRGQGVEKIVAEGVLALKQLRTF